MVLVLVSLSVQVVVSLAAVVVHSDVVLLPHPQFQELSSEESEPLVLLS